MLEARFLGSVSTFRGALSRRRRPPRLTLAPITLLFQSLPISPFDLSLYLLLMYLLVDRLLLSVLLLDSEVLLSVAICNMDHNSRTFAPI